MSETIFLINGPNLNLLGTREPEVYGHETLMDLEARARARATDHGLHLDFRQSNEEGELVSWIQEARLDAAALIINAAGYTHTSVAIHDALKALEVPVIELHLSNPHAREPFRHQSFIAPVASGVIAGMGGHGYVLAIDAAAALIG